MCSKSELDIILKRVRSESEKLFGDRLVDVILYGSYARGDYDDESDIDIMVRVNIPQSDFMEKRNELIKICGDLGLLYDVMISPHVQDNIRFNQWKNVLPFYQNVQKDGVRVDGT